MEVVLIAVTDWLRHVDDHAYAMIDVAGWLAAVAAVAGAVAVATACVLVAVRGGVAARVLRSVGLLSVSIVSGALAALVGVPADAPPVLALPACAGAGAAACLTGARPRGLAGRWRAAAVAVTPLMAALCLWGGCARPVALAGGVLAAWTAGRLVRPLSARSPAKIAQEAARGAL